MGGAAHRRRDGAAALRWPRRRMRRLIRLADFPSRPSGKSGPAIRTMTRSAWLRGRGRGRFAGRSAGAPGRRRAGRPAGGPFDGARGTAVGGGRSDGPGRLLAGVLSSSGGLAPAGRCLRRFAVVGNGASPPGCRRRRIRRDRRVDVAEDDRQAVLAAADDHDLGVGRLRELQRRFDAAPAHIGIRNALGHGLLEVADAVRLDLLALRFLLLAVDAEAHTPARDNIARPCG